jgi:hypothetical protein
VKFYAIAEVVEPVQVKAKMGGRRVEAGAILVSCPEKGYDGMNLLYCRYGLSVPYQKIRKGTALWIESRLQNGEQFVYTGFADSSEPISGDDEYIQYYGSKEIYGGSTLHLGDRNCTEPLVLGNKFLTELQKHASTLQLLQTAFNSWVVSPEDGGAKLKAAASAFIAAPTPDYSEILSDEVFTK